MSQNASDGNKEETVKSQRIETIERTSDEELKKFVVDYVDRKIFVFQHMRENDRQNLTHAVFFPLCAMDFSEDAQKQVGTVWEYYDKALPRAINGYPMFMSLHLMHVEDWKRAAAAIDKLLEKREKEHDEIEI